MDMFVPSNNPGIYNGTSCENQYAVLSTLILLTCLAFVAVKLLLLGFPLLPQSYSALYKNCIHWPVGTELLYELNYLWFGQVE